MGGGQGIIQLLTDHSRLYHGVAVFKIDLLNLIHSTHIKDNTAKAGEDRSCCTRSRTPGGNFDFTVISQFDNFRYFIRRFSKYDGICNPFMDRHIPRITESFETIGLDILFTDNIDEFFNVVHVVTSLFDSDSTSKKFIKQVCHLFNHCLSRSEWT